MLSDAILRCRRGAAICRPRHAARVRTRLPRIRTLRLEPLEDRRVLSPIDLVSIGPFGPANGRSDQSQLSADGRYVVFESDASNLVSGDTNGRRDIFVRDMQTGTITRANADSGWNPTGWLSSCFAISADGRYVGFDSNESNLVSGDTNGYGDVFVKDLQTGTTARVSTDSNGNQANGASFFGAISADGRYVVFRSGANNLTTDGLPGMFLKDVQTGTTTLIATPPPNQHYYAPVAVTPDGRFVAFDELRPGSPPILNLMSYNVFVKDLQTGTTTHVNTDANGNPDDGEAWGGSISADGWYVAFTSNGDNLVSGDTNNSIDVFVKDLQTGITTRVSTDTASHQASSDSYAGSISADGRYVAFYSRAENLVTPDTNGWSEDVFVKDRLTGYIAQRQPRRQRPPRGRLIRGDQRRRPLYQFRDRREPRAGRYERPIRHLPRHQPVLRHRHGRRQRSAQRGDGDGQQHGDRGLFREDQVQPGDEHHPQPGGHFFTWRGWLAHLQPRAELLGQQYDLRRPVRRGRRKRRRCERWHQRHGGTRLCGQRPDALQRHGQLQHRHARPGAPWAHVVSAAPNVAPVTENNVGTAGFSMRITYDKPMDTNFNPVVTCSAGAASTLSYNPAQSWWINNRTFTAVFDVADANVYVPHLGAGVSGAYDATGNLQTPYQGTDDFSINTLTTPATVVTVTPSVTNVTDNNVGTPRTPPTDAGLAVSITYSGAMDTMSRPTVTFSPDVSTTLTYDPAWSHWTSQTTYVAGFDVADADVRASGVSIGVAGARDAAGYDQARYSRTEVFSIDTLDPPPTLAHVVGTTASLRIVTDNNLGTAAFSVRITYDQTMRLGCIPTVTFSPDLTGTLSYNPAQSWWINNRTFTAAFDVADADVVVAGVGIGVTGARDTASNVQTPYNGTNNFSVDTLNPPVLAHVVTVTPSVATVTDSNVGTAAFAVRIAFDEAMNTNRSPAVTFSPAVPSTLTYDAAQSWWVSNTTFQARFDVADANVHLPNIGINVTGALDPGGNLQTPCNGTRNFSIDTLHHPASPAIVLRAVPSLTTITDANVGTAAFTVRIEYNKVMNVNTSPVVSFTRNVSGSLTLDPAWSWWVNDRTFVARYDVADADAVVPNIALGVTGPYDATGNMQRRTLARRSA